MTQEQREIHRKKRVLEYAEKIGNVRKTCRYFGVARSTFYFWRGRYLEFGDEGLASRRRVARDHPNKTPAEIVDKILHIRRTYHMGLNASSGTWSDIKASRLDFPRNRGHLRGRNSR